MFRPARVFALALFLPFLTSIAEAGAADSPIETRRRLMVEMIQATKIPRAMVRGEAPFDAGAVKNATRRVLEATAALPRLFPDGTSEGSAALPALFENRADFEARFLELEQAAITMALAARKGPGELAFAFGEYQAVCDGCHERYRKPE